MKDGDKIIWDSGYGYEIGYFIEESSHCIYNTYKINLVTGICIGITHRSQNEVKPYSEELAKELRDKYMRIG